MEDIKLDEKSINAYADSVWNESLTGETKLIDASLRTKPGKYDEEDLFTSLLANRQKMDNNSNFAETIKQRFADDDNYGYEHVTDDAYIPSYSNDDIQDVENDKVLIQRKKKREGYKKFMSRMAVAIVICGELCYGFNYRTGLGNKTDIITVDGRNIDAGSCAEKRLESLEKKYDNIISSKWLYIREASVKRSTYKYNYSNIKSVLKTAKNNGEIEFRIAVLQIVKHININDAYSVLSRCLNDIGCNFIEIEPGKDVIGGGYADINEYLEKEEKSIYYDVLSDTINKIKNGSIVVDDNGNFYEVSFIEQQTMATTNESNIQGRSK